MEWMSGVTIELAFALVAFVVGFVFHLLTAALVVYLGTVRLPATRLSVNEAIRIVLNATLLTWLVSTFILECIVIIKIELRVQPPLPALGTSLQIYAICYAIILFGFIAYRAAIPLPRALVLSVVATAIDFAPSVLLGYVLLK